MYHEYVRINRRRMYTQPTPCPHTLFCKHIHIHNIGIPIAAKTFGKFNPPFKKKKTQLLICLLR